AAADRLLRDAGRLAPAGPLFSARRRGAGEGGGKARRPPSRRSARQPRPRRRADLARQRAIRDRGARGDRQAVPDAALPADPAAHAGAGGGAEDEAQSAIVSWATPSPLAGEGA